MKRFLIIFAICFASIIGVVGGVFGVKYLKGDFNEKAINPEHISFEFEEYDVTDDFYITITTTTENVTDNKVKLSFPNNVTSYSYGKGYITDRNIIVPTTAKLGEPFKVELYKTQDVEADNNDWIKGGESDLIATSECITAPFDTTTIYVDVPVYKTELVMFSGDGEVDSTDNIADVLTYIEGQSNLVQKATSGDITLNAGDTFYLGLKFYPARSAYKYSKISSSNLLIEYYDEIIAKATSLGLDYTNKLKALKDLFASNSNTTKVDVEQLFDTYSTIINLNVATNDTTAQGEFGRYLTQLNNTFTKQLKYYTFAEKADNETYYTTKLSKVDGTNIYKMQATTESSSFVNSATAEFYSYAFYNSYLEDSTMSALTTTSDILGTLENLYIEQGSELSSKKIDKQYFAFDIVDVDVDTISLSGKIENFDYNTPHTIYAIKDGTSTSNSSYLQMALTNSNIQNVNLQKKVLDVGIRFEKHVGTNWEDATDEIAFIDVSDYKKVTAQGKIYYLPIGNSSTYTSAYWQVYFTKEVTTEFRARLVYFANLQSTSVDGEYTVDMDSEIYAETAYFRVNQTSSEKLVSWKSLDPIKLGIINITNALDMTSTAPEKNVAEDTKVINYNTEVNLSDLVNIPESNKYKTYKFFLFSDDNVNSLSDYFYNVSSISKTYSFNNLDKKLFELNGDKLKLKKIPTFNVKVIFATIKTDELTAPIIDSNGLYQIAEYSCIEDSLTKNLSSLSLTYENSIKTLKATATVVDSQNAGVAQADSMFKVAQNANDVIKVQITADTDAELELISKAIENDALRIEARPSKSNATNYISFTVKEGTNGGKKCYDFVLSTHAITSDVNVRLYAIYEVDGNEYLFAVPISILFSNYYDVTILKDCVGSVEFNFTATGNNEKIDLSQVDYISAVINVEKQGGRSEPTFTQTFTAFYKDGTTKEINVFNNQNISVVVKNFLGNVDDQSTDWSIVSSNSKGAIVDDGKKVTFVGATTAESVILYLYLNSTLAQQVRFEVKNAGKVSEVILKGATIYSVATSAGDYSFIKQDVSLFKSDFASDTLTYSLDGLLEITYTYNENSTAKLPLKVYVADEKTRATLNSICTSQVADLSIEVNSITLSKQLGSVISLNFVYVCKELNISQKVTITIEQMLSVSSAVVKQGDDEIERSNSRYNVYAGIEYTVLLESECSELYYYVDEDTTNVQSITKSEGKFTFKRTFEDNSTPSRKIHITNVKNGQIGVGDLNYVMEFNVQNNLKVKTLASKYALIGDTLTLNFADLFERINGSLTSNPINSAMSFSASMQDASGNGYINNYNIDKDGQSLTLTFKSFTDGVIISFSINANNSPLGGKVSMLVVPQDLRDNATHFAMYSGEKAIVLSNNEIVKDNDDLAFKNWFASYASVEMEEGSAFLGTYAIKEDNTYKIAMSTSELFVATNFYVRVTASGISSKYRVVLSLLEFPFVEFKDLDGEKLSYYDLDIYKLFEDVDDVKDYYAEAGIAYFTPSTIGDDQTLLNLVDYNSKDNAVYNKVDNTTIVVSIDDGIAVEVLDGDYTASSFVQIQTSTLNNNVKIDLIPQAIGIEGGVYVKVTLKLAPKGSSKYVNVPVVVYLAETQKLTVVYPNSGKSLDYGTSNYGTSEYDQKLTTEQLPFAETEMEYLSFSEFGTASLILNSNKYSRLQVYNLVGDNWVLNDSYSGEYSMSVVKIARNIGGVWTMVENNDFSTYANISYNESFYTLNVIKAGADVLRIKVKITTQGGANNYYYISVGEITPLNLMRSGNGTSAIGVGSAESISLEAGDILIVGESDVSQGTVNDYKYYYYLTNLSYNTQLKYRVLDKLGNVLSLDDNDYVTCQNNLLTIKVQPLGDTFMLEIYTTYGVLATITITVSPAYMFTLKATTVYSGTSYSVLDILDIVSNEAKQVTKVECAINDYYTCNSTDIIFNHLSSNAVVTLKIYITIDGYEVYKEFSNVQIIARIVSENYSDPSTAYVDMSIEDGVLTTYVANSGNITLSAELWATLFVDKKLQSAFDGVEVDADNVTYHIIGFDNPPTDVDITKDTVVTVGAITTSKQIVVSYEIRANGDIVAVAYARLTIEPQYQVTINYPKTISSTNEVVDFGCEYVQLGASIDFGGENFNGDNRISVIDRKSGDPVLYTIKHDGKEVTEASYTDIDDTRFVNGIAEFKYDICVGDYIYGSYIVKVIKNSPITIEQLTDTIYKSYGDDNVFGYIDAVVTIPQIKDLTSDSKIKLYISSSAGDTSSSQYKMLSEGNNFFYKSGEKIRVVIPTAYSYGTNTRIFVQIANSASTSDAECATSFSPRAKLMYYGNEIDYRYYGNILNDTNITGTTINNSEMVEVTITTKTPIVSQASIATKVQINYTLDIAFDSELFSGKQILSLNANMQTDGYSFVELFDVRDNLGNKFWLNHVSKNTKKIDLVVDSGSSTVSCLPLDTNVYDEVKYDFMLKPVGASNNGTKVKLTFTYNVNESTFTHEFTINILPDITHVAYNNDGTVTQNTESNPLKLVYTEGGSFVLASETQTNYVYAYSQYDEDKKNVIQKWTEPTISGDSGYITIVKQNHALVLKFLKEAKFGNKKLVVKFTDPYGYTFNYYIELIASIDITNVVVDSRQIYEGQSITVYNANNVGASNLNGIALTLTTGKATDTATTITIKNATFRDKNGKSSDVIYLDITTNNITFKYLPTSTWNNHGLSYNGTLELVISGGSDETYVFSVNFTVYKKYKVEQAKENMFVREQKEIYLGYFVDVYDYSQNSYLAKPILTNNEEVYTNAIDLSKVIIEKKVEKKEGEYDVTVASYINKQLDDIINDEGSDQKTKDDAWKALRQYGITDQDGPKDGKYSIDCLGIALRIKAIHKTSGASTYRDNYYEIGVDGKISFRLVLGENSELFDSGVDLQNYNFEVWILNLEEMQEYAYGKLATTVENDLDKADANGNTPVKLNTGNLYHVNLTISSNYTDSVNLALKLSTEENPIVITSWYNPATGAYVNITGGKNDFYLYNTPEGTFEGIEIELFTGEIKINPEESITYINGLASTQILSLKNITEIRGDNLTGDKYTPKLIGDTFSESEAYGIRYQSCSLSEISVTYSECDKEDAVKKNAKETGQELSLNVTTYYTGVDTSDAYVSSIHYCYVNDISVGDNGALSEEKTIELSKWSKGFELEAGVGVSAIFAKSEEKSFENANAKGWLIFEIENVKNTTNNTNSSTDLCTIEDGNITLKEGFKPNDYYVAIRVYCKYGEEKGKKESIGVIYVSFISVTTLNAYEDATNKQYKIDISSLAGDTITKDDISLGLFNITEYKNNTITITGDLSEDRETRYELIIGEKKQYVYLNIVTLQAKDGLKAYKLGNGGGWVIFAKDLQVHNTLDTSMEEKDIGLNDYITDKKLKDKNLKINNEDYVIHYDEGWDYYYFTSTNMSVADNNIVGFGGISSIIDITVCTTYINNANGKLTYTENGNDITIDISEVKITNGENEKSLSACDIITIYDAAGNSLEFSKENNTITISGSKPSIIIVNVGDNNYTPFVISLEKTQQTQAD